MPPDRAFAAINAASLMTQKLVILRRSGLTLDGFPSTTPMHPTHLRSIGRVRILRKAIRETTRRG
eukprot:5195908-Heterocapsa_arctica.AAC.1